MELDRFTLKRAQQGDRDAQEVFLRRYVGPLHSLLSRSGTESVQDSVQELLSKLLGILPRFDPGGSAKLTTWVFTVAHRWVLDQRRRKRVNVVALEDALAIADPREAADRVIEQKQTTAAVEAAIARLPDEQRRVFVLAQIHEQPLEEVAKVEGIPIGTVKSRLHRARAQLALALGPILSKMEGANHGWPRRA